MGYRFVMISKYRPSRFFTPKQILKKKRKYRLLQGLLEFLEWRGWLLLQLILCQLFYYINCANFSHKMGVLGCDSETHFDSVWIPGFWLRYLGAWHYKRIQNWWDSSLYWWFDKLMQILLDFIVVRMHTVLMNWIFILYPIC